MELPEPTSKVTVLSGKRQSARAVAKVPQTIEDSRQPHCADHSRFMAGCPVCRQACANFQPYPVKKNAPSSRSFGSTGTITEEKLQAMEWRYDSYDTEPEASLSLWVIRFVLRLIWPFSRIL